jgi:mannose-6-phosphate isomerase-like protein (cupin superfamily)
MKVKNITRELESVEIDNKTNIKIALMTGNQGLSVYAAEIAPKTELNPHYHKKVIEIYQILEGNGVMRVGKLNNNTVEWTDSFEVVAGDCFSISENKVHQIVNNSNDRLRVIFCCPSGHLGNDRFFVK